MPDIPPALAFGPQLAWPHRTRSHLVVGQTRMTLPGALRPYHASRWRGRRAASLRPLPEDAETGASPATSHYHYVIQDRDAGCFLSACVQLRVTRDLVSEYCRPFIGPVLYDEVPPRGRGRLRPALDGHRWREPVALLPWPAGGWVVAARAGRILRHRPGQTPCLLLDLTAEIGPLGFENGLLSLAWDPQFPTAPFLYVYYTRGTRDARSRHSRLARFPVADGLLRREEELAFRGRPGLRSRRPALLGHQRPARARPGAAAGLAAGQDPAPRRAAGQAGTRPEAYARGFRNPWRLAFAPRDGALWVADMGYVSREEVNRVQAGADYGGPPVGRRPLPRGARGLRGAPRDARLRAGYTGRSAFPSTRRLARRVWRATSDEIRSAGSGSVRRTAARSGASEERSFRRLNVAGAASAT